MPSWLAYGCSNTNGRVKKDLEYKDFLIKCLIFPRKKKKDVSNGFIMEECYYERMRFQKTKTDFRKKFSNTVCYIQ